MVKVYLTGESEQTECLIIEAFTRLGYRLCAKGKEAYIVRMEFENNETTEKHSS